MSHQIFIVGGTQSIQQHSIKELELRSSITKYNNSVLTCLRLFALISGMLWARRLEGEKENNGSQR